jgi:hypothetical protein
MQQHIDELINLIIYWDLSMRNELLKRKSMGFGHLQLMDNNNVCIIARGMY